MFESFLQDVGFALRTFRKNPGFAAAALVTLAIGIGANTAIYSVIDGALLHPVPFSDPDRLVILYQTTQKGEKTSVSLPNLLDWNRLSKTFEAIGGYRHDLFTMAGPAGPESAIGTVVSAELFSVLRVQPIIGRTFTAEEDRRGDSVVLLGEDFWRRRFSADPAIIGKPLTLNSRNHTVLGIVPSNVRLGRENNSFMNDVFVPLGQDANHELFRRRGVGPGTVGLGRLKPEFTIAQAQIEMDTIMRNLAAAYPDDNANKGASLTGLTEFVAGNLRGTFLALAAAVGFVLLIACTNVANLALARSAGRSAEFGVRQALGASRGRIVRQLLTESALISITGGTLGVLIAAWSTEAALSVLPSALPAVSRVEINGRVLFFTLVVSLAAGLLFGLAPAVKATSMNLFERVKQGGRGTLKSSSRVRRLLVVSEIALTLLLLVGAGLMLRSLQKLWMTSPGFNPEHLLSFYAGISPQRASTPEQIRNAMSEINDRLSSIPGVEAASVEVGGLPFRGSSTMDFLTENDPEPSKTREPRVALFYFIGLDHFRTMGVPLLRGRSFTNQDRIDNPLVVIVDEELARSAFGDEDPIGKRLRLDNVCDKCNAEIIGIAGHVKQRGLESDATDKVRSEFYFPIAQLPDLLARFAGGGIAGLVRSKLPPALLMPAIRKELAAFDSSRAIYSEMLMTDAIANSLAERRFSLILLGTFALTALLLSVLGIYSVVSYFVSQRTNDIGVRIALGARPRDIFGTVLGEGAKLAAIGLVAGIAGAAALTRLLKTLLFGISPFDAVTFVFASVLLFLLTLLACYLPARRAIRIDPITALRSE